MEPEDFTFFGRIKRKRKINSISEGEWNQMRTELLTDGKNIFSSINKLLSKSEIDKEFYGAVMDYYDERINTLPKDMLHDLYISYRAIKDAPDKEGKIILFVSHVNLMYGLEGWFTKKLSEIGFWRM